MVNYDGHILLTNLNGLKKVNIGIKNKKINHNYM